MGLSKANMKNDSLFIKALYFGRKHANGFTKSDLEQHLDVKEAMWGPLQKEFHGQKPENAFNQADYKDGEHKYWLTKSGHLLLAQLDDVRQTREEAGHAQKLAILSIVIAAILAVIESIKFLSNT